MAIVTCFQALSDSARHDWEELEHGLKHGPRVTLFSEGDQPVVLYAVLDGEVRLSVHSRGGRCLIPWRVGRGELVGLAAALTGRPHGLSAETSSLSEIMAIDRRVFQSFLVQHPEAYSAISIELARQLALATEKLRLVGVAKSAGARLAGFLLEQSGGQAQMVIPMTHDEIGHSIAITRENVTRAFTGLKQGQYIRRNGSRVEILNRKALEQLAAVDGRRSW